jgi:peptidoglycan/LPS O-acetylase OafA/YrhL
MSRISEQSTLRGRVLQYRPELDGLRAVSLLFVLSAHLGEMSFRFGFLGVDVFFVLSGFLITELLLRSKDKGLGSFYKRRFARLAPALLVMVGVVTLLGVVGVWSIPWWASVLSLTYTMNMVGFFTDSSLTDPLTPTWSLAAEEQYYLVWPLLLAVVLRRFSRRGLANILVLLFGVLFIVQFFVWDKLPEEVLRHGPVFRPAGLLLGGAVALYGADILPKIRPYFFLIAGLALIPIAMRGSNGMFIALTSAMVLLAVNKPDRVTGILIRALSVKPLTAIGRRSYSLYLWNLPSMMLVANVLGSDLLGVIGGLVLTFVVGFASFHFVEIPFLRWYAAASKERKTTSSAVVLPK